MEEVSSKPRPTDDDGGFTQLNEQVARAFAAAIEGGRPLFRTSASDLPAAFLDGLPAPLRRMHTCGHCRRFLRAFGGLAVIGDDGGLTPALWPAPGEVPPAFARSVDELRRRVQEAQVTGVFLTSAAELGKGLTGEWNHFCVPIPAERRHRNLVSNAGQLAAQKAHDLEVLRRGLDEFSVEQAMKALEYLTSGQLYRSDKAEAVIHWLLGVHEIRSVTQDPRALERRLWLVAAQAPPGFCHVRSTMIGTLLEDIAAGLAFDDIKARWASKMAPSQYMRAQAAPAAGNIAQAEKIIAALRAAGSLARRFARLSELQHLLWRPAAGAAAEPQPSVFGHLTPKNPPPRRDEPPRPISWEEFEEQVLPQAREIEVLVPASKDRFVALVTAAQPDAPPILQWDSEQARNPVSWYYAAGIDAEIRRRVLGAGGTHEGVDIRASLLWNNRNDLDLHAITPAGEHIYYGAKKATCGGWLDVDMNVSGNTTTPVENIRWMKGSARPGRHQFFVINFRFHEPSQAPTPFKVELEVSGEVYHLEGVISPRGETGEVSKVVVAEFDHAPGGALRAPPRGMRPAQIEDAWGVAAGQWVKVTGVTLSPNLWGERPLRQHGRHVFFLLAGCKDSANGVGRGFFVETLKSDFFPIRSTLEAYAASATIEGADDADACGIGMSDQAPWGLVVRVRRADGPPVSYKIEQWARPA